MWQGCAVTKEEEGDSMVRSLWCAKGAGVYTYFAGVLDCWNDISHADGMLRWYWFRKSRKSS